MIRRMNAINVPQNVPPFSSEEAIEASRDQPLQERFRVAESMSLLDRDLTPIQSD